MDLSNYLAKSNPVKTLLEHTEEVLAELEILREFQYISSEHLYHLTKKACQYHDYGKANREFQNRILHRNKFNETKEIVHNVLSVYFIPPSDFESLDDYCKVAEAVLNHHSYGDTNKIISQSGELIQELLGDFAGEIISVEGRRLSKIQEMLFHKDAILVKGYLHRCDYSASAGLTVEYPNDFLEEKLDCMMMRWLQKSKYFIGWNPLQEFCIKHSSDNIIVTAQTGMGKTEAGLLWLGNHKGFFVLPIRTAINEIYDRIRFEILEKERIEERLALLHSENLSYYTANVEVESISLMEYQDRSKQLCMPITVTTLDQIFDFVFKYAGYEMKLATLSYSKLIIDEIQMYDAQLLAYLIYGIAIITKYGGKVAILTATLSPFVRNLLKDKGFDADVVEESFTNDLKRHSLKVYHERINSEYIIEKYEDNKQRQVGNKILVVCNTVKAAQKIYRELDMIIPQEELHILHNKFIKADRSKLEKEILEFGKTYNSKGEVHITNGIWVTTSIVEASLDIDFDYLFTELSDLNGLLQRLGRCNRKGIKLFDEYNCFVFTEIDKSLLKHGDKGFIDKTIYELSKEALSDNKVNGLMTEYDKLNLIENYFTSNRLKDSDYMREFDITWNYIVGLNPSELEKAEVKLRNIVTYTIIPACIYELNYKEIQEYIEKYNVRDTLLEDKIRFADEVRKYTLNVEPYVLSPTNKKAAKIVNQISIGKKETIYIIDCDYTEIGFQMKVNDGVTFW